MTFYALDFENRQAVFVETSPQANLSQAPFYFQAQYENALCVVTLSFETMIQLAQSVTLDDSKLIFIHSMGRSRSTLASKIFAQIPGVINMSEPDVLTQLVAARLMQPDKQAELKMLMDASVRLLYKTRASTGWVIKGRSWMQLFVPPIARYDPNQHLSATGFMSLLWLENIECYMKLHQAGVEMMAIPYPAWKLDPRRTASAMLDYCACRPDDLTAVEETLAEDSQAGSTVSQDAVKNKTTGVQIFDPDELNWHLQSHSFIHTPDFEAPNTLKL